MTSDNRLLLRDGIVLTMDPDIGDLDRGDVLIEDGRIAEIGRALTADAETFDCAGKIVLPGFVNSHQHMFQTALRSYWSDAMAVDYFAQSRSGPKAILHHYTPEDVYWGEFAGALENLFAGTTTVVDTSQCSYTPDHTDAALDAIRSSGIRCVFSFSPTTGENEPAKSYAYPVDIHRLMRAAAGPGDDSRIRLALGYFVDAADFRLGRELGLPVFAHVNNASSGRALEALEPEGLLGTWNTYIHCTGLDDSTWQVIERTGGKVSLSCLVEQNLGMGVPAVQAALDHGVAAGLSADTVSLGPIDFFSQMRAAFALQRSGLYRAGHHGETGAARPVLTRDILRMATIDSAEAAHVDDLVGALTPGKRADVVVLNGRSLNAGPVNHATGAVVQLMDTSNVEIVIVDGQVMKWGGRLVGVDVDDVLAHLTRSTEGLLDRSGYPDILLTSCRRQG